MELDLAEDPRQDGSTITGGHLWLIHPATRLRSGQECPRGGVVGAEMSS
jgi:hypothetical protein